MDEPAFDVVEILLYEPLSMLFDNAIDSNAVHTIVGNKKYDCGAFFNN
jgi:hypothetical protein